MNEVARMQQCALSSASALVDRMIRLGFAERRNDPEDRRIIRIVPTPLGEQMLLRFDEARQAVALEALAPLSDQDLEMKFRSLADPVIGAAKATSLSDACRRLGAASDVRELVARATP